MMPGFLYKLASYVFEIPVEKRQSQYSGKVAVSFHQGQYKLSSANAVYSFGTYYTSFSIPFNALEVLSMNLPRVLVLGMGLGSVVNLLEKNKSIHLITAVDADAVILELAEKYLLSTLSAKVEFVCADAAAFLEDNRSPFELILVDLFVDDKTPVAFLQESFLLNLKKSLAANGLLFFSKLNTNRADTVENAQFEKIFSRVFPEAFTILADGNKVFCFRN
jgi:predicted membrane-bound spermidine synthase